MTFDDVKDMDVDRFCAVIEAALETGQITGAEALRLIQEFWKELRRRQRINCKL